MNNIFTKSYWGFDWKQNLTTDTTISEFSKNRLGFKKKDIPLKLYEQYSKILDDQISEERERLNSIESKAIQITGQISIVLAIAGLIGSFGLDKIPSSQIWLRIFAVSGLLIVTMLFVYAILCALRNFDTSKYKFVKTSEDTIIDHYDKKIEKLNHTIINDKILELRTNRHSTNAKASNVIYSTRAFKAAILALAFYLIAGSIILFSARDKQTQFELTPNSINDIKELIKSNHDLSK
jgi:hypothetical protein